MQAVLVPPAPQLPDLTCALMHSSFPLLPRASLLPASSPCGTSRCPPAGTQRPYSTRTRLAQLQQDCPRLQVLRSPAPQMSEQTLPLRTLYFLSLQSAETLPLSSIPPAPGEPQVPHIVPFSLFSISFPSLPPLT